MDEWYLNILGGEFIQQTMTHLNGVDSIKRIKMKDEKARTYFSFSPIIIIWLFL